MSIRSKNNKRKVYKYVHHKNEYLITNIKGVSYCDPDGWLEIKENGTIHIYGNNPNGNGYAWDGCTPKWEIADLVIGTPDGRLDYYTQEPMCYYASMVHDILYQFKEKMQISRKDTDKLFYKIMMEANYFWSKLYFCVVTIAGSFFGNWMSKKSTRDLRIIECSWIKDAHKVINTMDVDDLKQHPFYTIGSKYDLLKYKLI